MGLEVFFERVCELVQAESALDFELDYQDLEQTKSGDYYYLRMEQLYTNKGWASPVWINWSATGHSRFPAPENENRSPHGPG